MSNINIVKLTLKQLLINNTYFGGFRSLLARNLKPYIVGCTQGFIIFNIKTIRMQFKLLLHFIFAAGCSRQPILFVNHHIDMGSLYSGLLQQYRPFSYWEGPWLGGLLTNFKTVRLYSKVYMDQLYGSTRFFNMPTTVFFLNITAHNWGVKECSLLNIPSTVVTGGEFNLVGAAAYPLTANNLSPDSLVFYVMVSKAAHQKGLLQERYRILKLTRGARVNHTFSTQRAF